MKTQRIILAIVLIQIFLLVNLTTANSYLIHQTDDKIEKAISENKKEKDLSDLGINLLIGIFSIKQIGIVSAVGDKTNIFTEENNFTTYSVVGRTIDDITWNCCIKTKNGAICQDTDSAIAKEICNGVPAPTKCSEVMECKIGCCLDGEQGLCSTKSTKAKCENEKGKWFSDEACLVEECQKGCCVLGKNVEFATEKRCEFLSSANGFQKDFRDYQTELECLVLKQIQKTGACVIEKSCSVKTESECAKVKGKFYEDKLCSAPSLETKCKKQTSVGCVEGKDEIYWFDSCGNQENIYSYDREKSWNNGEILGKEKSCGANSSNIDSKDCGNCNYFLGSKCSEKIGNLKIKDGNFVCKDLNCPATEASGNKERKNGESWCVYDSFIGEGKDTVGSRHWKRMCIDGEIKIEPCADYRGQICVQSEIESNTSNEKFTIATCVINRAMECINSNGKDIKATEKKCKENSQCQLTEVKVNELFQFNLCTPKYPGGFDLSEESSRGSGTAKQLCSIASQQCLVMYEKKLSGWTCILNCECLTKKFAEEMNNLCISVGDCGNYVNFVGDGTDNAQIKMEGSAPDGKKAESNSWKDYKKYVKPVDGQKIEPDDLNYTMKRLGFSTEAGKEFTTTCVNFLGTLMGATGIVFTFAANAMNTGIGSSLLGAISSGSLGYSGPLAVGSSNVFGIVGAGFSAASIGFAIGSLVGGLIAKLFGLSGQGAMILTLAGGVMVMTLTLMAAGFMNWWNPVGWALIIIAYYMMIFTIVFGIGKTKEVVVEFQCLPWEAPTGGTNCEKCNGDLFKPCSEYRCSSLGQACKLVNADTTNPICIAEKNDGTPPIISVGEISEGYKFVEKEKNIVSIVGNDGECIPEFTNIIFSLKTDEYAQCKWSYVRTEDYETLEEYFAEANSYTKNHTNLFMMPSMEALQKEFNLTIEDDVKEKFANPSMYVRCQDSFGNYNKKEFAINFCIKSGPDISAAKIVSAKPVDKAMLKYGINATPLTIWMNEPTTCKYDIIDGNYTEMKKEMQCENSILDLEDSGWPCKTSLTELTAQENKIYIKCLDQPWLIGTENESNRNVNTNSFVYTLFSSRSELKIDAMKITNVTSGFEPVSVNVELETSGGISNGESLCYYSFTNSDDDLIEFKETLSNKHRQLFTSMMSGNYKIYFSCKDNAGNYAVGEKDFSVNVDSSPPIVVRVYNSGKQLNIITDEDAVCYYNFERCNYDVKNATLMTTGLSKLHRAEWKGGKTYYVKCEDKWKNTNPDCAIKVVPESAN